MELTFTEKTKRYVKLHTLNDFKAYKESKILDMMIDRLKDIHPKNVLELGAGLGRGSVYIFKKLFWIDTKFYLLDGDSGNKTVGGVNVGSKGVYYNSLDATKEYCNSNGLKNLVLINYEKEQLPKVKFDIVYSIISIGFHWSIDLYLKELKNKLNPGALLLFQTRSLESKNKQLSNWAKSEIEKVKKYKEYKIIGYDCKVDDICLLILEKV